MKKISVSPPLAHLMALLTAVIWGTTYLATQELLAVYTPMQIMLMRFAIAYVMLWLLCPHPLRLKWRDEGFCLLLGIIGCTLYFLSEVYSLACGAQSSTLSIFFAASPIVTALLVWFFIPKERPRKTIFIGFAVALVGVVLVVYNGHIQMQFSLAGYLLALCSCICWGTYSFLLRKKAVAINGLQLTRRIIFWGFLTTLPVCLIQSGVQGISFSLSPLFGSARLVFCLLFLGMVGSGLCYSMWSLATSTLGSPVVTCYLYVSPFATMLAAFLLRGERVTLMGACGAVLILGGVVVSERWGKAGKTVALPKPTTKQSR